LTSSFRPLSINLVRRTKRSACLSWTRLATGDQRVVGRDRKLALAPLALRPNAYDAEPRLGVELLRGGLPEELRSPSFPPAPAKKRLIPSAARCAGWGSRRFGTGSRRSPQADARAELRAGIELCSLSVGEPPVKRGALVGVNCWAGGGRLRRGGARSRARGRPALYRCSGLLGPAT
jgi:hypothetical protein